MIGREATVFMVPVGCCSEIEDGIKFAGKGGRGRHCVVRGIFSDGFWDIMDLKKQNIRSSSTMNLKTVQGFDNDESTQTKWIDHIRIGI